MEQAHENLGGHFKSGSCHSVGFKKLVLKPAHVVGDEFAVKV